MSSFSRNLNHHWKYREHKENFQTIMFNSFLELYTVLVQVPFATSKTNTFQIFCQGFGGQVITIDILPNISWPKGHQKMKLCQLVICKKTNNVLGVIPCSRFTWITNSSNHRRVTKGYGQWGWVTTLHARGLQFKPSCGYWNLRSK